jgi:hypothetical protein
MSQARGVIYLPQVVFHDTSIGCQCTIAVHVLPKTSISGPFSISRFIAIEISIK